MSFRSRTPVDVQDRAGAEKQESLEDRVIERVIERRDEPERARQRMPVPMNTMDNPRPMRMIPMFSTE